MARTSRIEHPPGSRFIMLYAWAVRRFGFSAAAILGYLDFVDRVQQEAGMPLCSRLQILAALEGVVGRNCVDAGLKTLTDASVVTKFKETEVGEKNLLTRVDYGLNVDVINRLLACADGGSCRKPQNREFRQFVESELDSGASVNKEEIRIKRAAAHTGEEYSNDVAHGMKAERKQRRTRRSGIVTWNDSDIDEAALIESTHPQEQISSAVSTLSHTGKEPVPGRVGKELQRLQREQVRLHDQALAENSETLSRQKTKLEQESVDQSISALLDSLPAAELELLAERSVTSSCSSMPMRIRLQARDSILNRKIPRGGARAVLLSAMDVVLSHNEATK